MILIDNRNITDPHLNLALEEYALRHLDMCEDYLLLYVNEPAVIIGKHQNPWEEANLRFLREQRIPLLRRISGGGAVYHDRGNLNFSFITRYRKSRFNNYREFTRPVIETLRSLGVPTELNSRNDIVIGERKISGNAQFTSKERMLSHGTLLFSTNLENMRAALKVESQDIESKSIKSVRSRVTNISEHLPQPIHLPEFKGRLLKNIFRDAGTIPVHRFTEEEWERINDLAEKKYRRWEWNFGEGPRFRFSRSIRLESKELRLSVEVEKGLIGSIQFSGELLPMPLSRELEKRLKGIRYSPEYLEQTLQKEPFPSLLDTLPPKIILKMLF